MATDDLGHTLSAVDYFSTSNDHVMVSDVYTKCTMTIYSWIGNLFAWLSLLGLGLLIAVACLKPNVNSKFGRMILPLRQIPPERRV